jgi:hypothetical protein
VEADLMKAGAILLLALWAPATLATTATAIPIDLAVGESKTFTIAAVEPYNYTHLRLVQGKTYRFTVGSPAWNNGDHETDAGGYNSTHPLNRTRRHVEYKVMALVGEIFSEDNNKFAYTGSKFLIGLGRDSYTAPRTGYLVAFANDCLLCYVDNSRVVTLAVRRLT